MQKILNYIKNSKGIGALWLFGLGAVVAFFSAYEANNFLPKTIPYIQSAADAFLPLKVTDGKVVIPQDTVKTETYESDNSKIHLTLDTTKDLLDEEDMKQGFVLTRSYFYTINGKEIRRQPLTRDFELENKDYTPLLESWINKIVWGIVFIGPFFNFIYFLVITVFYAFLSGFACVLAKTDLSFRTKMRLNSLLFVAVYICATLADLAGLKISLLGFFLLMIALQIVLVQKLKN